MTSIKGTSFQLTRSPMVTAGLALQLLQSSQQLRGSEDHMLPPSAAVETKIASLQRALRETTASVPPSKGYLSAPSPSFGALRISGSNPSASTVSVGAAASTSTSDDSSAASWEEEEEEEEEGEEGEEEEEEDRCRLGATVRDLSRLSLDDESLSKKESGSGMRRQASYDGNEVTPLDEFDHPALAGVAACLHGYAASAGDPVFLEKAYEMARTVAASKHELSVVLDACRMALAAGFVHTFTKGAPDMANTFAQQHSLSKLAQSLKTFWARSPGPTQEEVFEWDQCMLSLLEIASSVSAMTGERDVLVDLDAEVYSGVTGAIGSYLVRRPSALRQYHDVGSICLRHHLLSAGTGSRLSTDSE